MTSTVNLTATRTTESTCRAPALPRTVTPSSKGASFRRLLDRLMRSLAAPSF